jgi:hypothetical protein
MIAWWLHCNCLPFLMRTSLLWIQPRQFIAVRVRLVFGLQVMWTSTPAIHPHLHIIRFLVRLLGLMRTNKTTMNDGQEWNGVAFARAAFGFQNSSKLWRSRRPRMDLDSGVQILSGKLLESTFICIKAQVHIISEPATIIILVQRPFSANGAATPYFGSLGRVSCWVQFRRILGLEHDPASLRLSSHTYKT